MRFETLSVFPEIFEPYLSTSIMGRARAAGIFEFEAYDLRNWTHDKHHSVDDAPYGGGAGMLMAAPPFFESIADISAKATTDPHIVFFSPAGRPFNQECARELAERNRVLFVCGRYEGIDERAFSLADELISLGDYVLTGGELAAMVVMDAVVRLLPGALGDEESSKDESFSDGLLEYAQYTRPADYDGMTVPEVLLSGNHAQIAAWRRRSALERTARMRPDLIEKASISERERSWALERVRENTGGAINRMDEFDDYDLDYVDMQPLPLDKARSAPAHLRDADARQGLGELPGYSEPLGVVGADEGIASSRYYNEPQRSIARLILDMVFILVAGIACFLAIRTFVGEAYKVPTGSMLETIQLDDLVWGEKLSFRFREPQRGDIVTFEDPKESGQTLIKRVIATEGQSIEFVDGQVFVDGVVLNEPYVNGLPTEALSQWEGYEGDIVYPFTVPAGMLWVMGDNRTSSSDSRYFGPIERDSVTSRAFGIYWPPKDMCLL